MPEGDTIRRTALTLHAALAGKMVLAFESSLPAVTAASRRLGVVGQTLEAVEARGKHLLVRFAGGAVLHTHQGMRGSWSLYRRTGAARSSFSRARAVIETADVVAVCSLAPVVEMLSPPQAAAHPALARLGPDLLGPAFDAAAARRRLRARGDLEIRTALMDQTALAGIGNVYKSGLTPGRLWVYRRSRQPCRRCGTAIERAVQGEQARSTYFCPACQRSTSHVREG